MQIKNTTPRYPPGLHDPRKLQFDLQQQPRTNNTLNFLKQLFILQQIWTVCQKGSILATIMERVFL